MLTTSLSKSREQISFWLQDTHTVSVQIHPDPFHPLLTSLRPPCFRHLRTLSFFPFASSYVLYTHPSLHHLLLFAMGFCFHGVIILAIAHVVCVAGGR